MNKIVKRETKGITLIALVITIIVLLILAGISISMLSGDNSILNQAGRARDETIVGQEKEQVELAYISAAVKKLGDNVTSEELQHELDLSVGKDKTEVAGQEILNVLFTDTNHSYQVKNGTVEKTEIFDVNDGIYIGDKKVSLKIHVPTKDEIVSDILVKGHSNEGGISQALCDLSMINSDYIGVLKDLNYIDENFESFIKNNKTYFSSMNINGIPMFQISKTAENEYYLILTWDYLLDKDNDKNTNNNLFESKVRLSSKITFTSSDYTSYELGDLTVEESKYVYDTTNSTAIKAPFEAGIPDANNKITNFSIKYNNKKYEGKDGLKDFLDNIVGLKNNEIAKTYVDMGAYVYGSLGNSFEENLQQDIQQISKYLPLPVQNADVLTKYMEKSNSLDGIYVKGQRIGLMTHRNISKEEEEMEAQYISYLLQTLNRYGYFDLRAYDYFLSKQIIDPLILSTALNSRLACPDSGVRCRNIQIGNVELGPTSDNSWDVKILNSYDITVNDPILGEILDTDLNMEIQIGCSIETDAETGARRVVFGIWHGSEPEINPECISLTLFHSHGSALPIFDEMPTFNEDEVNYAKTWDILRKKGLLSFLNENILPFPDKDEFLTIANEYAAKDSGINNSLSVYNSPNHNLNDEVDLYISIYRAIILEAFENGTYEIKSHGKTYTGKKAVENYLIEEYGFDDPDTIRAYANKYSY